MFDTNIVVIGNVLSPPEWRRTSNNNALVANFRIASTARRQDRETGQWVDGHHLRVRVNCWRRLAEGVASSVTVGDPVVVTGRLYTRDWTDAAGNLRTSYEMEAVAVGHDLSRGRAKFFRAKHAATVAVAIPESEDKVRGEHAPAVPESEAPISYGDGVPQVEEPSFEEPPAAGIDPALLRAVRGGGFEPFDTAVTLPEVSDSTAEKEPDPETADESEDEAEDTEAAPATEPEEEQDLARDGTTTPAAGILAERVGVVAVPKRSRNRSPRRQPVAA
ncbi:single-stranded DNA-binding protein [Actinoplanes sp. N902-109]|uniref:single-stranded DNA-binding protein n=1 Tax=Actinoplanes sp. (strain N902-109) TaxID=649831 RepID=UPI0003295EF5|nr:single-stranded DNA-binding protein [Actinoplanes sp. N902-109]AGL14931.1 single-strand binding protein [Actinoplanes sp. N902-109]